MKLISSEALAQYMEFRGFTVRSLAVAVDRKGKGRTSSRSIIGHLRSGRRDTCRPATARLIEECLQAPPGSLFVPSVSRISRDAGQGAAA